ncbi:S8 family serine peptidase [Salinivirga cyanobacteriivorans]
MRKLPIILFVILSLCIPKIYGQNTHLVHFANGDYQPVELKDSDYSSGQLLNELLRSNYQYIQFRKNPDQNEIERLRSAGIELLDYVPYSTWAVKIDHKKVQGARIASFSNIRSVFTVDANYKIDNRLTKRSIPEYAEPQFGKADINVLLYDGCSLNNFLTYANEFNVEVLDRNSDAKKLTLRVSLSALNKLPEYNGVKWIEPITPEKEFKNIDGYRNHQANVLGASFSGARNLTGDGVMVGEWDGGAVGAHHDLYGRVTIGTEEQVHWHSTHVAGTIMGRGILDPKARGTAPNSTLYSSDFIKEDFNIANEMLSVSDDLGVDITSNSWGYTMSQEFCENPFPYISSAYYFDNVAFQNKKLTHVFANGNDQQVCPGGHWTSAWTMKNAILVGAINDKNQMTNYSSWGPLFDGRMAPHICAVGKDVYSTLQNNQYYSEDGTSMATPAISGGIALLYEQYKDIHGVNPGSAIIRSVLFNSATDLGAPGPDYAFGFGRVNFRKAAVAIEEGNIINDQISDGSTNTYDIDVPNNLKQLKVTIAWTDEAGSTTAAFPLVNDLDMRITGDNQEFLPWVLDKDNPEAVAERGVDRVSNFEQITIDNPTTGVYTIEVDGYSIPISGSQSFTITYEFVTDDLHVTYPVGGEVVNPSDSLCIRWDANNKNLPVDIDISYDNGATWESVAENIDGGQEYYTHKITENVASNALVKVSQGAESDICDVPFQILGVPENLKAVEGYQSIDCQWDSVPGATGYDFFQAVEGELVLLGSTNDTTFHVDGLETGVSQYLTVKAKNNNLGITSKHAKAIAPKAIPQYDLAITKILEPVSGINLSSAEQIKIQILNVGAAKIPAGEVIPLKYTINSGSVKEDSIVLEEDFNKADTLTFVFSQPVYMSIYDTYNIEAWHEYSADSFYTENNVFDTRVSNNPPVVEFPYTQDFDNFRDLLITSATAPVFLNYGWNNDQVSDDMDWWPNEGETYLDGTGPYADHTSGQGKYLYTEAVVLQGVPGEVNLLSPGFKISTLEHPVLYFWYHMFSQNNEMGSLHIDIYSVANDTMYMDVTDPIVGSQGDQWFRKHVDLTEFKNEDIIRIYFRSELTEHDENAIAIDDVSVRELEENDLEVIALEPVTGNGVMGVAEPVTIRISNLSPLPITAGTTINFSYQLDGQSPTEESYVLEEDLNSFDSLSYTFNQTADLSDLTRRYQFKAWVDLSGDQIATNDTLDNHIVHAYCKPRGNCYSNGYPTGVDIFKLEGIHEEFGIENLYSVCGLDPMSGYSFFGDQIAKVYSGQAYPMQIRCIVPPPEYNQETMGEYFKIWIDFDQNGYFDEDEVVFANDQRDIDLLSDTIHIPEDAVPGRTRLRIRSSYYPEELISGSQACTPISHGETEDYGVEILPFPHTDINMVAFNQVPVSQPELTNNETISVKFVNQGLDVLTEGTHIPFKVLLNEAVMADTLQLSEDIAYEDTVVFELDQTLDLSTQGSYRLKIWSDLTFDEDPYNDTLYTKIQHMQHIDAVDYQTSFETADDGWFDASSTWNPFWERGVPNQDLINSADDGNYVWMTGLNSNYLNNASMMLYSPVFDFTNLENPIMRFSLLFDTEAGWDGGILESSTDGINWSKVEALNDLDFYNSDETNNPQWAMGTPWWSGTNAGWKSYQADVQEYAGAQYVMFRFRFNSDGYENAEGMALDKMSIVERVSDLGITDYFGPTGDDELTDREYVEFSFANIGTTTFSDGEIIDVTVRVNDQEKNFNYELMQNLEPGDTIHYQTPESWDMSAQQDYNIMVRIDNDNDELSVNNLHFELIDFSSLENNSYTDEFVKIYPNPADTKTTIFVNRSHADGKIIITDYLGNKVKEIKTSRQVSEYGIDLTNMKPGIYIVSLSADDKTITRKFIVK